MKKKILFVIGTRPEAVKIAPVYRALQNADGLAPMICLTGQHPAMADEILSFFQIRPDFRLEPARQTFSLAEFTGLCLTGISAVLEQSVPDLVFVHGDTSSTFCGALAAYYQKIPVAHLEAGLRTGNKYAPFPEEMLRRMTGTLADIHFAPTARARDSLLRENVGTDRIHVVGNSVVDALLWATRRIATDAALKESVLADLGRLGLPAGLDGKTILITGHRRENFGGKFETICRSIKTVAAAYPGFHFIYPVHLNPNVQDPVRRILDGIPNVHLIPPVNYPHFVYLMQSCRFILTDSGGIQEEAPSLGKPVLVMREETERPEAVEANCARLVGADGIVEAAKALMEDPVLYNAMSKAANPYGDGTTSERIVGILRATL